MIAVDTSALVAVILGEDDADSHAAALLAAAGDLTIGAPTLLETQIVLESRQGPDAVTDLQKLIDRTSATVEAFTSEHVLAAHRAWRRFGKGRHPAALNLGDCCSYATAKLAGSPLLYKGSDFSQTDIASVL